MLIVTDDEKKKKKKKSKKKKSKDKKHTPRIQLFGTGRKHLGADQIKTEH